MNPSSKLPPRFQKYASFGVIPKLLLLPFAFILVTAMLILRPFVIIQVYPLDWQLGHLLVMSRANELRTRQWNENHRRKKITIYCVDGPIASRYALKKLRESLWCAQGNFAWLLNYLSGFASMTQTYFAVDRDFGTNYEITSLIKFTKAENKKGEDSAKQHRPLVCLNVRDQAYNSFIIDEVGVQVKDWTNRNSDIKSYRRAAEFLANNGYTVFRMGAKVENSFACNNPMIIDYATNGMRTEFLDFYLAHECNFAISTSSGWDEIPTMFQRPLLLVNHYDFLNTLSKNCLVYPKMLFDTNGGRYLSLSETIEMHLNGKTNQKKHSLRDFGIELKDLSSEDLVDAVTEMAQRVKGTFVETSQQREMRAKVEHILRTHPKLQMLTNHRPVKSQFASCFLNRHSNFCE